MLFGRKYILLNIFSTYYDNFKYLIRYNYNRCMVYGLCCSYATFNNCSVISWRSILLVEKTRVPGENHRPVAIHCQTLSHNVASRALRRERVFFSLTTLVVIGIDCTSSCKSNYHTITTTTLSSTNKNDSLDIVEILLKVALTTITLII